MGSFLLRQVLAFLTSDRAFDAFAISVKQSLGGSSSRTGNKAVLNQMILGRVGCDASLDDTEQKNWPFDDSAILFVPSPTGDFTAETFSRRTYELRTLGANSTGV